MKTNFWTLTKTYHTDLSADKVYEIVSKNLTTKQFFFLLLSPMNVGVATNNTFKYTTFRPMRMFPIITKGKFEKKYGRIEARIKLPRGKGLWPAFWMLGANSDTVIWPQCGEIDIMEYVGSKPTEFFGTVHGPGYYGGASIGKTYTLPNSRFDTDFHVFGIEWDENYINFYVDDKLYNQITPDNVPGEWVFNESFYIILNVAVGGNLPGSPNSETPFPQTMLVDYIRIYE